MNTQYRLGGISLASFLLLAVVVIISSALFMSEKVRADDTVTASTTVSIRDLSESTRFRTPSARDLLDVVASVSGVESASAGASTSTNPFSPSSILDNFPSIQDLARAAAASSTSTTTPGAGLGESIADAITGGSSGFGTSDIGPFVKCVLLAGVGWPIPTFSSECPLVPETPPTHGTLTIIKNTIGGNGNFGFTLGGAASATTTLATSLGSASVQFILNPGNFTISEDALSTSTWSQTGRECTLKATTTGSASGSLGWSFSIGAGQHITCTFINTATSTSTTTPGGGGCTDCGGGDGECTVNCGGGGGCVSNCGGSSGSSGGGGGGGGGSSGGGNGPIFQNPPGVVAGASTTVPPEGMGGAIPEVPNTGAGGSTTSTLVTLVLSFLLMSAGAWSVRRTSHS